MPLHIFHCTLTMKKLSKHEERRIKISIYVDDEVPLKEIALKLKMSYSTVKKVASRYRETGNVDRREGSGGNSKLSIDDREIILKNIAERHKTSSKELVQTIFTETKKSVSRDTIRRVLTSNNLKSCVAVVKPLLSDEHKDKRFKVAKEWLMRPFEYFKNVIFSDESRFNIFQSDDNVKVWRAPGTRYDLINCSP